MGVSNDASSWALSSPLKSIKQSTFWNFNKCNFFQDSYSKPYFNCVLMISEIKFVRETKCFIQLEIRQQKFNSSKCHKTINVPFELNKKESPFVNVFLGDTTESGRKVSFKTINGLFFEMEMSMSLAVEFVQHLGYYNNELIFSSINKAKHRINTNAQHEQPMKVRKQVGAEGFNALNTGISTSNFYNSTSPGTFRNLRDRSFTLCQNRVYQTKDHSLSPATPSNGSSKIKFNRRQIESDNMNSPAQEILKKKLPKPISSKLAEGLPNLKNTCFMNAPIQVLLHTPLFVNFIIDIWQKIWSSEKEVRLIKNMLFIRSLVELILKYGRADSYKGYEKTMKKIKNSLAIRDKTFRTYNQEDFSEFLSRMFQMIMGELLTYNDMMRCKLRQPTLVPRNNITLQWIQSEKDRDPVTKTVNAYTDEGFMVGFPMQLFGIISREEKKCLSCKKIEMGQKEHTNYITMKIPNESRIEPALCVLHKRYRIPIWTPIELLMTEFGSVKPQLLTDYMCSCGVLGATYVTKHILKLPKLLLIYISRTAYSLDGMASKVNDPIDQLARIDLFDFLDETNDKYQISSADLENGLFEKSPNEIIDEEKHHIYEKLKLEKYRKNDSSICNMSNSASTEIHQPKIGSV